MESAKPIDWPPIKGYNAVWVTTSAELSSWKDCDMPTRWFDDIATAMVAGTSRRSLLRGVLGAATGGAAALVGRETLSRGRTVEICHRTWAWSTDWRVITVNASDTRKIQAHLEHGDYLGSCVACPVEGAMECDGTGFRTCDHGIWVHRDCAPGTVCEPYGESIVCSWEEV
jgi:hypothetical protein